MSYPSCETIRMKDKSAATSSGYSAGPSPFPLFAPVQNRSASLSILDSKWASRPPIVNRQPQQLAASSDKATNRLKMPNIRVEPTGTKREVFSFGRAIDRDELRLALSSLSQLSSIFHLYKHLSIRSPQPTTGHNKREIFMVGRTIYKDEFPYKNPHNGVAIPIQPLADSLP